MRAATVAGVAVAAAVAVVVGCASFGAADGPGTGANDGGAGDDGGSLGSSGGPDGAAPDGLAAVVCSESGVVFDESFGAGWETRWDRSSVGAIHADTGFFLTEPASLAVDLDTNTTAQWIGRDLGLPCHVHAEVQLHVGLEGDGNIDLFSIADVATPEPRGVAFIFVNGAFAVEYPQEFGVGNETLGPLAAGWLLVTLDVDLRAGTWGASFGGVAQSGVLPSDWPAMNHLVLKLGTPWQGGSRSAPWSIRFDDVAVR
jgi:hypothetical protein